MESVRWLRGLTPGPKLTTRNTVPLASVAVPMLRAEPSALPSLSTGKPSLVQITAASAPGRVRATFLMFSSIDTIAWPFLSWPVTTRRIVRLIGCPPHVIMLCAIIRRATARLQWAARDIVDHRSSGLQLSTRSPEKLKQGVSVKTRAGECSGFRNPAGGWRAARGDFVATIPRVGRAVKSYVAVLTLDAAGGKPTLEHRIRARSRRSEQLQFPTLGRANFEEARLWLRGSK